MFIHVLEGDMGQNQVIESGNRKWLLPEMEVRNQRLDSRWYGPFLEVGDIISWKYADGSGGKFAIIMDIKRFHPRYDTRIRDIRVWDGFYINAAHPHITTKACHQIMELPSGFNSKPAGWTGGVQVRKWKLKKDGYANKLDERSHAEDLLRDLEKYSTKKYNSILKIVPDEVCDAEIIRAVFNANFLTRELFFRLFGFVPEH